MTDPVPQTAPAPNAANGPTLARWLKPAFFASLALNLAVLGVIGGAILRGPPDGANGISRDLGFGPFTEALSPEDREQLAKSFVAKGGNPREIRRDMRAEFGQLLVVLRADPFDPAQLRAAFDAVQARGSERLDLGQQLLSDRIVAMTPEDRAHFADRLEERMAHAPLRNRLRDGGN